MSFAEEVTDSFRCVAARVELIYPFHGSYDCDDALACSIVGDLFEIFSKVVAGNDHHIDTVT